MKKKELFRRIFVFTLAVVVIVAVVSIYQNAHPSTVRAFGELTVDFNTVTAGDPIFVVNNMAPGNSESRVVDVTNGGTLARFVAVKGIKKTDTGALSTVLSIVIREGAIDRYGGASSTGSKHLSDFFADSADPNGVQLSILGSGDHTAYTFIVSFDTSADNPFQGKQVVFDLTFGIITAHNLVINEVYYDVAGDKGTEDKNEWIEIYNPTDHEISLKNWKLVDNSGAETIIHANKAVPAGGFALISKDADTWKFWNENKDAKKIELGNQIGDGLRNDGDKLILKDTAGNEVDWVAWKGGFTGWDTNADEGKSIQRNPVGTDTDTAADWVGNKTPSPGLP